MKMKLGTKLEILFKYTGIKFVVKWLSDLFNIDCGCEERKDFLDNLDNIYRNGK